MHHKVTYSEIGMICIYMTPSDKAAGSRSFWSRKPLVPGAGHSGEPRRHHERRRHHTHYGYSNHGTIRENGFEISDPHLTMCVELIGQRGELERFLRLHDTGDLPRGARGGAI